MRYYVIVWKHDTWKLADDKLYTTREQAWEAIKKWLITDGYVIKTMGVAE